MPARMFPHWFRRDSYRKICTDCPAEQLPPPTTALLNNSPAADQALKSSGKTFLRSVLNR